MSTAQAGNWVEAVTVADLRLHGVEIVDGESAPQALVRLTRDWGVSLHEVGSCLALLRSGRCLLSGGAPLALLAYSPRRGVYRAVYDGECGPGMAALSPASAGVWLVLLASKLGRLPDTESHWLVTRLTDAGVVTPNDALSELVEKYVRTEQQAQDGLQTDLGPYERLIGQAFWGCVAHCRQ